MHGCIACLLIFFLQSRPDSGYGRHCKARELGLFLCGSAILARPQPKSNHTLPGAQCLEQRDIPLSYLQLHTKLSTVRQGSSGIYGSSAGSCSVQLILRSTLDFDCTVQDVEEVVLIINKNRKISEMSKILERTLIKEDSF